MNASQRSAVMGRRTILKAGAAVAALPVASPFIIRARGDTPVRIGMVDPVTGVYAAVAQGEVEGAKLAADQLNTKGGILGRPVALLIEDSANDVAIRSRGSSCSWNVYRVCTTTAMDANAIASTIIGKLGKKWYFLTPDYAYGHSVQASFEKVLKAHGGTSTGSLIPIGTADYSAYLIQAKAYAPQVVINVMGGGDQVNSLKQFVQFGLDKQMAVAGTLCELESLRAMPDEARIGWWTMEWWWDQSGTPHVKEFNDAIRQRTGRSATARNRFGYVSVHTAALIANQERTLDPVQLAHALSGFKLPPEIALQPGAAEYRAEDHELMSTVFVGEAHSPKGDPDNLFTVRELVPGARVAGSPEDTGCKLRWPA